MIQPSRTPRVIRGIGDLSARRAVDRRCRRDVTSCGGDLRRLVRGLVVAGVDECRRSDGHGRRWSCGSCDRCRCGNGHHGRRCGNLAVATGGDGGGGTTAAATGAGALVGGAAAATGVDGTGCGAGAASVAGAAVGSAAGGVGVVPTAAMRSVAARTRTVFTRIGRISSFDPAAGKIAAAVCTVHGVAQRAPRPAGAGAATWATGADEPTNGGVGVAAIDTSGLVRISPRPR